MEYRYRQDTPSSLICDRVLLNAMPIIQDTLPVHTFRRHDAIRLLFRSPVPEGVSSNLPFNLLRTLFFFTAEATQGKKNKKRIKE